MGAAAFAFRAELRSRWRSWLAIALLVAVVGGFVLAATAAGRRTTSAYPQFVATYGYDATVFATRQVPQLERLATVASATAMVSPSNGQPTCLCTHPINVTSANFAVLAEPRGGKPLWKLVSGRAPDPADPDQVLASLSLQRDDGVQVGTVIHVPFFAPSQASAANSVSGAPPTPRGPAVALQVVGITASEFDFPSGTIPVLRAVHHPRLHSPGDPAHGDRRRVRRALAARGLGPAALRHRGQRTGALRRCGGRREQRRTGGVHRGVDPSTGCRLVHPGPVGCARRTGGHRPGVGPPVERRA